MTIWSSLKLGSTIVKCLNSAKTNVLKTSSKNIVIIYVLSQLLLYMYYLSLCLLKNNDYRFIIKFNRYFHVGILI